MRADLLWEHFETLVKTPEDADALSRTIIQLGMSGKLLPQDPSDTPAPDLFAHIDAIKKRLMETGQAQKSNPLLPVTNAEIPFELPESWSWVRLGDIADYAGSESAESDDVSKNSWVLYLEDIEKDTSRLLRRVRCDERPFTSSKRTFRKGDVLYGKLRPYLDKVLVADEDGVCSSEIVPIKIYADLDPQYLRYALKRPDFIAYVTSKSYGTKMPRLGTMDARMALVPLAPLNEQKRIVAKLDELLTRTRKLAAELQAADDLLEPAARASFQALVEAPDQAARRAAWQRIEDGFEALTSDPRAIDALKQTILDLAVRGLLVPQDPNDEPAGGSLRSVLNADEIPFTLPEGWVWTKGGELFRVQSGYAFKSQSFTDSGIRLLRNINVGHDEIVWHEAAYVPSSDREGYSTFDLRAGDVVVSLDRPLISTGLKAARVSETDLPSLLVQRVGRLQFTNQAIDADFAYLWLKSSLFVDRIAPGRSKGVPHISPKDIEGLLVPVPPVAEQRRIVDQTNGVLRLCDVLGAEVARGRGSRQWLQKAVINGARDPRSQLQ